MMLIYWSCSQNTQSRLYKAVDLTYDRPCHDGPSHAQAAPQLCLQESGGQKQQDGIFHQHDLQSRGKRAVTFMLLMALDALHPVSRFC